MSRKTSISCGFCKNAGFYGRDAAHLVKECPLLAKTECRYCRKLGHTKVHCAALKEKNDRKPVARRHFIRMKTDTRETARQQHVGVRNQSVSLKPAFNNRYAVLEDAVEYVKKVETPTPIKESVPLAGSWVQKLEINTATKVQVNPLPGAIVIPTKPVVCPIALWKPWGDAAMETDSEEEDEEEEEVGYDNQGRPFQDNSAW